MVNTQIKVEGKVMTITVDLSHEVGPSKSGKSIVIASTEGNASVNTKDGAVKVGLNVYRSKA